MVTHFAQGALGLVSGVAIALLPSLTHAQVIPDGTTPTDVGTCGTACQIRGGTVRGVNLFHSFQEFNVNQGQQVRFDNAADIQAIFTRVTGGSVSTIDGLLGTNGTADLFLLNPNGILFGENARLDIGGSFVATTAERFTFPDGSEFSAVNPQAAPLLTVNVPVGLQSGANPGVIANRGILSVGGDLTLGAGTLDLQGELNAGGNLTLTGLDSLSLRDSPERGAIATANGNILLESNALSIAALSHPTSQITAGGDLVLRSSNPVEASAALQAGGSVTVETPGGLVNRVFSPAGMTIQAGDSVTFGSYDGASLQILAGGSVTVPGGVTITEARTSRPTVTEEILLLEGDRALVNGSTRPTSDIRAGRSSRNATLRIGGEVTNPGGDVVLINPSPLPSSRRNREQASILVGDIFTGARVPELDGGQMILNAQGDIQTGDLDASVALPFATTTIVAGRGGTIRLASRRGDIQTGTLTASSTILTPLNPPSDVEPDRSSLSNTVFSTGGGGTIRLSALNGAVQTRRINARSEINIRSSSFEGALFDSVLAAGEGGQVIINTRDAIEVGAIEAWANLFVDSASIERSTLTTGGRGAIIVVSNQGDITTNGLVSSTLVVAGALILENSRFADSFFAAGDGGPIFLSAPGTITFDYAFTLSSAIVGSVFSSSDLQVIAGQGGAVTVLAGEQIRGGKVPVFTPGEPVNPISTREFPITVDASSFVQVFTARGDRLSLTAGRGGNVRLLAFEGDLLIGQIETASRAEPRAFESPFNSDEVFVRLNDSSLVAGNSGRVRVEATSGSIHAGDIIAASRAAFGSSGDSGSILLRAGEDISTGTLNTTSQLNSGRITILAGGDVFFGGGFETPEGELLRQDQPAVVTSDVFGNGSGGQIRVAGRSITLADGSQISASTYGRGRGGNVLLNAETITIRGRSEVEPGPDEAFLGFTGTVGFAGGAIGIPAGEDDQFIPTGNTTFFPFTRPGTDQTALFPERPLFSEYPSGVFTQTGQDATGSAGFIIINTDRLLVEEGGAIAATTFGRGSAGNIIIRSGTSLIGNGTGGSILSGTADGARGRSGFVSIFGDTLVLDQGSILTETNDGPGGTIFLSLNDTLTLRGGSRISTTAGTETAGGNGGDIRIRTGVLTASPNQDNDITANAFSGRGGTIDITAEYIVGLQQRSATPGNGTNDIDASSRFQEAGRVIIRNPSTTNPVEGLLEFPETVTDPVQQIATTCPTSGDIAADIGEFIITGRGGIPENPADILAGRVLISRLATLSETDAQPQIVPPVEAIAPPPDLPIHPSTHPPTPPTAPLEAQTWTRTPDGTVILTAASTAPATASLPAVNCSTLSNPG
ncbi:MAG: filamentous hemagglutinin N-terminal domain-containing protein [Synechococcales bacterium]|nr:filamentous hemagglutinin N-terminal domain-containing protein [Synechococcales bacterium]